MRRSEGRGFTRPRRRDVLWKTRILLGGDERIGEGVPLAWSFVCVGGRPWWHHGKLDKRYPFESSIGLRRFAPLMAKMHEHTVLIVRYHAGFDGIWADFS